MKINVQNRLINIMKVLFLLSIVCMGVLTEKGTVRAETSGDYRYMVLDDGTVEITRYIGWATEVIIPEKIAGKSVASIGDSAFRGCSGLTEISIPNSVTRIGAGAFSNCSELTKIVVSAAYAEDLITNDELITEDENWIYKYEGTEDAPEITIVAYVGADTEIVVPQRIGKYYVTRIESFETSLSSGFRKDDNILKKITSISLPAGIYDIGDEVFYKMPALATVKVTPGTDDVPTSYWQPYNGVGARAFSNCPALISVELPKHIASISEKAFLGCEALVSVDGLSEELKSVGTGAFDCCYGLTEIDIPNSVTSIGRAAFYMCSGLTEVSIPNSVVSIGDEAFSGCSGLATITVDKENKFYDSRDNCNAIIETKTNSLIAGCKATSIPNSVTSIRDEAFRGCSGLTEINIPKNVTNIGVAVFSGCTSLTEITVPNSVTNIGEAVFRGCIGLTAITIPNSVTSIRDEAFRGCTSLTEITIPNSVTSIEESAFENCSGLTEISIPNSVTHLGMDVFKGCKSLIGVRIPKSVTRIDDFAFDGDCNANLVLFVEKDSYAETYAIDNKLNYEYYTPIPISTGTMTLEYSSCEYDGTKKTPTVTVTLGEDTLVEGKDYRVSYFDNKEIGTATVVVNGIGDYVGTLTATFAIKHTVHKYDNQESGAVAPTYRTKGKTAGMICSVCGETVEGTVIPELTFSISYDGNGATTVAMKRQAGLSYLKDDKLSANTFVRDGYDFVGWNLAADGTGTSYKDEEDFSALIEAVEDNDGEVLLYAQWKKIEKEPTTEQPTTEQPTSEQPSTEQPTTEEPTPSRLEVEIQQAIVSVEKQASEAKAAVDKLDTLTEQEKEEYKTQIDKLAEQTKSDIEKADDVASINERTDKLFDDIETKISNASETSQKKVELKDCVLMLTSDEYQYTQDDITPQPIVLYNGNFMEEGKHYKVMYVDNTKCGTASVIVEGIGDRFTGMKKIDFKIVPNDYQTKLNQLKNYTISNQAYTGKAIKISKKVSLTDGDYTLEEGTDYDITYKNNVKVGTAKVTYKCKNNYAGKVTLSYKIVPNAPKGISRDKKVTNNIKIKWKKVKEAGGYKVYRSTNKKKGYELVKTIKSNKTLSYTDKKAKKGKTYYYKIVAFKKVSDKTYESADSAIINAKR